MIDGTCESFFKSNKYKLPLPHVGFNKVDFKKSKIWNSSQKNSYFYFVHSHRVKIIKEEKNFNWNNKLWRKFCIVRRKRNIFGAQFHPEKSNNSGLIFLKKFCELK